MYIVYLIVSIFTHRIYKLLGGLSVLFMEVVPDPATLPDGRWKISVSLLRTPTRPDCVHFYPEDDHPVTNTIGIPDSENISVRWQESVQPKELRLAEY